MTGRITIKKAKRSNMPPPITDTTTMRRVQALRSVMQKVLRVMSASGVRLALADPRSASLSGVPGWTNGQDVTVNREVIESLLQGVAYSDPRFAEVIAAFYGVCYHELGHILYSPRTHGRLGTQIRDLAKERGQKFWWAYNGLEDQRMETLFTGRYVPTEPYFNRVVSEWLTKTPEALVMSHALVWGRRYLPDSIRLTSRMIFEATFGVDLAQQFAEVIDDYCDLILSSDQYAVEAKALRLIIRYKELLDLTKRALPPQPSMDNTPDDPSEASDDGDNAIQHGEPDPGKQQDAQDGAKERQKDRRDLDDLPEPDLTDDADNDGDDGDQDSQEGEDGSDSDQQDGDTDDTDDTDEGEAEESGDGDGDTEGDGTPEPSDHGQGKDPVSEPPATDDNQATDPGDGQEPGGASDAKGKATPNDLFDRAKDLMNKIEGDESFQAEVQNAIDAVAATVDSDDGLGGMEAPYVDDVPMGDARTVVRKIMRDLQALRLEAEAVKVKRQTVGRLNMRRFMEADDDDMEIFDQWDTEQEEAGGVDVVVLLDLSGSMQQRMTLVSQMMWALKTSFDRLDIRCTVLGFASDWCVLYKPGEKATKSVVRQYGVMGGTTPFYAIREAHRLLMGSDLPNRVLVTITDGQWFPTTIPPLWTNTHLIVNDVVDGEIKEFMDDLHNQGTSSLLIGIYDADAPTYNQELPVKEYGNHLHELAFDTCDLTGVPITIANLVRKVLSKANASHLHG